MEIQMLLDAVRTALAIFFLVYSSWSDSKTREVSNTVWMFFAPPALALTLGELLLFETAQLIQFGLCFGLTSGFAMILFYAGGFGGADAKALICLALALPFYPAGILSPLFGQISPISATFFPITVFSNSVILVMVPVIWMIARNLNWKRKTGRPLFEKDQKNETLGKRILVFITGYKFPISRLKEKWHIYPLEDIDEKTDDDFKRKLVVVPKDQGRDATVARLEKAVQEGKIQDGIWASPGLPMLILITAGLIITLFLGDIIWTIITSLLR